MNSRIPSNPYCGICCLVSVECEEISGAKVWDVFQRPGADDVFERTSVFCRPERSATRKKEVSPQGGRNR